jgi:hypothetical protein
LLDSNVSLPEITVENVSKSRDNLLNFQAYAPQGMHQRARSLTPRNITGSKFGLTKKMNNNRKDISVHMEKEDDN